MGLAERKILIERISKLRGSTVICFLTTLRPNVGAQISDDCVRAIYDHLLLFPARPVEKLDLFLVSNGGAGTVSWRLVSLLHEFTKHFGVIVPYRAYSAATMIALGADEIVMHPFGELGPIDPTVSNDFNPMEQGRRLGISVEDVKAYVTFIKSTVGITHEDELIKAIEILANKVHPLALGNVERFISQSRMIARKILRTHMDREDDHTIDEIVENMASKLYFHGHPINRQEAKADLHLKIITDSTPELETTIWELYKDFEEEFQNQSAFNPAGDLAALPDPTLVPPPPAAGTATPQTPANPTGPLLPTDPANPATPPTPSPSPAAVQGQLPPAFLAQLAGLQAPVIGPRREKVIEYELLHAMVESARLSSRYTTKRRYTELPPTMIPGVPFNPGQPVLREDILEQGWHQSPVP